jgi:hypothetical protein
MQQKVMSDNEAIAAVVAELKDIPQEFNIHMQVNRVVQDLMQIPQSYPHYQSHWDGVYDKLYRVLGYQRREEDGLRLLHPDGTRTGNWLHVTLMLSTERDLVCQDLKILADGIYDDRELLQSFGKKEALSDKEILKIRRKQQRHVA